MTEKGSFIRVGTASEPMPQKMIEELFAKRTRNSLGKIISRKQDLRFEQLRIFYEEAGFSLNENFAANLELLADSDKYNYIAYLLSDNNSTSIKVAKYASLSRNDLIENNEYGYACLIRAAKRVLDKIELENPTATKITSKERVNKTLWIRLPFEKLSLMHSYIMISLGKFLRNLRSSLTGLKSPQLEAYLKVLVM